MEPKEYSQVRYLSSKKSVDDESLNRKVLDSLEERSEDLELKRDFEVLEVGAGIGCMLERCIQWGILPSNTSYTAVEIDEDAVETGKKRLKEFAEDRGYSTHQNNSGIILNKPDRSFTIEFKKENAFEFIRESDKKYDLLIAHAFLDLVDLDKAMPLLLSILKPNGLFYFPITFDGVTSFRPEVDHSLDLKVERIYHENMGRKDNGELKRSDSIAGRRLFDQIAKMNAEIINAGSSDWVVYPGRNGYDKDIEYFLHHIINLVKNSIEGSDQISEEKVEEWALTRHEQIENQELVYIAHQLDFLGKV